MSNDSGKRGASPERDDERPYRVHRSGGSDRSAPEQRPYTVYRSAPRGLRDRLRPDAPPESPPGAGGGGRDDGGRRGSRDRRGPTRPGDGRRTPRRRPITVWRVVRWVIALVVAWIVLSVVLFFVSAQSRAGHIPASATPQLGGGSSMLFSPETVLILGLDNRPRTGPGSKEGGLAASDFSEADANTDSIMLWRIGGGVSRRLSIPRDTLVTIPGCGTQKINAAWSCIGAGGAIKVIKAFTGIRTINHLIVVDLANFPKFINDIGGVNVKTGRICSNISGGTADGGFTLDLKPGEHHLDGLQALLLARTRDNSCNAAYDDLNREAAQQQILNSIKSQLLTVHTFFHLPWAAYDAPGVIQTDMGGATLMQMFLASEIGGSAPPRLLKETASTYNGADVLLPNAANVRAAVRRLMTGR